MNSFTIYPADYNSTIQEAIDQAKRLGMSYEIIKPSWLQKLFSKPETRNSQLESRIHIHPHGLNDEQRLHSLMIFFHFLGKSKTIHPTAQSSSDE